MGFLGKLFQGTKYPELDPQSEAARMFDQLGEPMQKLAKDVNDRLEVIVGHDGAYVFIGKPPKAFGVMWIENGQMKNLRSLAEEKHLEPKVVEALVEKMRRAYSRHDEDGRFSTKVGDREVVVHPSDQFEHELEGILQEVSQ